MFITILVRWNAANAPTWQNRKLDWNAHENSLFNKKIMRRGILIQNCFSRDIKENKDVNLRVKCFRCDKCVYKILVHSSKSILLTCSHCNLKCKHKKSLEKHSLTHLTPQRTYPCFKYSYLTLSIIVRGINATNACVNLWISENWRDILLVLNVKTKHVRADQIN